MHRQGGDTEEVLVERLAKGGDGIAHLADGRVAFLPRVCPGDVVRAEITEDHGSYVRAAVRRVVESSPDRIEPSCPHQDECGGCHWRHISYERQLLAKRAEVADGLERIGRLDPSVVGPTVPSPSTDGYRNKAEFVLGRAGGKTRLGYTADHGFVPVDRCALLPGSYADAPKALAGALGYLLKGADAGLARVALRVSTRTRDVEIALWGSPGPFPRQLAAKVLSGTVAATSVVRVLVKGDARRRSVQKVEVLSGKGHWTERLSGMTFTVSAPSFFQVNTAAAESLVDVVRAGVPVHEHVRALDVYSGVGTFTLPLAARGADVSAFEEAGSAVRDLRRNLERARLHAEVVPGDAARSLRHAGPADVVVVDPPRSGVTAQALEVLSELGAERIVYVSCDPATLARDASALAARGYRLSKVTPVDLFPQTYHVESVAVLDRG